MHKIQKISDIDTNNITFDEFVDCNNGSYIMSKIWIANKQDLQTLFVQTSYLKPYNYAVNNITFLVDSASQIFLEKLDELSIKYINKNNLVNKYNLKNFVYKTLVNETENKDQVCRTRILENSVFFSAKTKQVIPNYNVPNEMPKVDMIKIIFEVDSLVVDMKKKAIFTNIIVKHFLLHKNTPKKVELTDYSFIESDNESDKVDIVMNMQTEKEEEKYNNEEEKEEESDLDSN